MIITISFLSRHRSLCLGARVLANEYRDEHVCSSSGITVRFPGRIRIRTIRKVLFTLWIRRFIRLYADALGWKLLRAHVPGSFGDVGPRKVSRAPLSYNYVEAVCLYVAVLVRRCSNADIA